MKLRKSVICKIIIDIGILNERKTKNDVTFWTGFTVLRLVSPNHSLKLYNCFISLNICDEQLELF